MILVVALVVALILEVIGWVVAVVHEVVGQAVQEVAVAVVEEMVVALVVEEVVGLVMVVVDLLLDIYTTSLHPVIGGPDACPHCFCSPCVVSNPPTFLFGSSAADLRNANKRYPLYEKFWRLLKELGLWRYEPYLVRKCARTIRTDVREIMPSCVKIVSEMVHLCNLLFYSFIYLIRK